MKIVVTGALGHIGSRLVRELPDVFEDCGLIMIDNFLTQRYCSLFNLPSHGKYQFIEGDITKISLEPLLADAVCVIHLAAITDAESSFNKADEVEQVNVLGTECVARACIKENVPLVFISTTSVYGSQSALVDESCSDEELKPQSPYAHSKLKAEKLLSGLSLEYPRFRYQIYRFGTISGVSIGMRFHTAVNKFCFQAALNQPITIWRTALYQKRPYLSLDDAIRALMFTIQQNIYHNTVYNVVTENLTPHGILQMIRQYVPQVTINYTESKIMNQLSYEVSCARFKELGFSSQGSIRKDIAHTIQWLKQAGSNGHFEEQGINY